MLIACIPQWSYPQKNFKFAQPEPVYVITDMIKPNLDGDFYVWLLTSLHFPSRTGYHIFNYPFYKRVEQSLYRILRFV